MIFTQDGDLVCMTLNPGDNGLHVARVDYHDPDGKPELRWELTPEAAAIVRREAGGFLTSELSALVDAARKGGTDSEVRDRARAALRPEPPPRLRGKVATHRHDRRSWRQHRHDEAEAVA